MKIIKLLFLALPLLSSCNPATTHKVLSYHIAYQTSEVQEYTHDLNLAKISDTVYIEVPQNYHKKTVQIIYNGNIVYYWIEPYTKVSNQGWVYYD